MSYQKNLKSKVEYCLKTYPYTRDSDIALTIRIWKTFYKSSIKTNDNGVEFIVLQSMYDLPREDGIKRIRAKIQNHKTKPMYLPKDYFVRRKRKISEETWRKHLGYEPEFREI